VVVIGVVIAAIGLGLAIVGMLVPTAPPQLASLGWVLLAIGLVLIVVALVLNGVDGRDNARSSWGFHADALRSSWGLLLVAPGLRTRWRASWGGPEA
jgi:uncharacterized membrane protein